MKDKQHISNFIEQVATSDFKKAHVALAAIVNEKIKQRIVVAHQNLNKANSN